jgi:hypothetical protein
MVLGNLEEEASTAEGLVHHEGSVELAEDLGRFRSKHSKLRRKASSSLIRTIWSSVPFGR